MKASKQKYNQIVYLSIIFILLLTPLLDRYLNFIPNAGLVQKDKVENIPGFDQLKLKNGLRNISKYYDRTYSGRSWFIKFYNGLKLNLFGISPLPEKVIIGDDDWYFLGNSFNNVALKHTTEFQYTEKTISDIVSNLKSMNDFCSSQGIKFYFTFAPDKHFIYSEKLPNLYKKIYSEKFFDELYIKIKSENLNYIDLRKELINYKNDYQLYEKTGSHWNDIGAYLAYEKIINTLAKDFPNLNSPIPLSQITISEVNRTGKDIVTLLGKENSIKEADFKLNVNHKIKEADKQFKPPNKYPRRDQDFEKNYKNHSAGNNVKGLFLRDSYFTKIIDFIVPHFNAATFLWKFTPFLEEQYIDPAQTDFIVLELTERSILELAKPKNKMKVELSKSVKKLNKNYVLNTSKIRSNFDKINGVNFKDIDDFSTYKIESNTFQISGWEIDSQLNNESLYLLINGLLYETSRGKRNDVCKVYKTKQCLDFGFASPPINTKILNQEQNTVQLCIVDHNLKTYTLSDKKLIFKNQQSK